MIKNILYSLMAIGRLDWKACLFGLIGFFCALFADKLAEHYGVLFGIGIMFIGWWCILAGLVISHRKADLPVYKIGER